MDTEMVTGLMLGIGLAAACGFRVFVPLLAAGVAVHADMWSVSQNMDWIGTWPALMAFGSATALEIAAYYVPWVDNLLDSIATPAAAIAGTLATATFITGMDPISQWALATITGGGTATVVQSLTVTSRAASSVATGGLGNPLVSTVEAGASSTLSILTLLAPLAGLLLVVSALVMLIRMFIRRMRGHAQPKPPVPA